MWMTYDTPRSLGHYVNFTTDDFGKYIPGLVDRYGSGEKVAIRAIPMTGGNVDVNADGIVELNSDIHL
jgi:hypothetical protein